MSNVIELEIEWKGVMADVDLSDWPDDVGEIIRRCRAAQAQLQEESIARSGKARRDGTIGRDNVVELKPRGTLARALD